MSLYMVTTYLGASIGQLSLNIPDPSGTLVYILISIIFSIALIPGFADGSAGRRTSRFFARRLSAKPLKFRRSALPAASSAGFWSAVFIFWAPFMPQVSE